MGIADKLDNERYHEFRDEIFISFIRDLSKGKYNEQTSREIAKILSKEEKMFRQDLWYG